MKKIFLFFTFLAFLLAKETAYAKKYPVEKKYNTEKNGFKWMLLSTRYGNTGILSEGFVINDKTIIPLYCGVAYIRFQPLGNSGIIRAENVDMKESHKRYIFFNLDGELIYETENLYIHPAYDKFNGLYFKDNGDFVKYLIPKRDSSGRIVSQKIESKDSKVVMIGESGRDDRFQYGFYGQANTDSNGNPTKDSFKFVDPKDEFGIFEICFSYSDKKSKFPVHIYMNEQELDHNSKKLEYCISKSEYIGSINRSDKSCVDINSDKVNIYVPGKHILIEEDGRIFIFEIPNGTYANSIVKCFEPTDLFDSTYKNQFKILVDKLKQIEWE